MAGEKPSPRYSVDENNAGRWRVQFTTYAPRKRGSRDIEIATDQEIGDLSRAQLLELTIECVRALAFVDLDGLSSDTVPTPPTPERDEGIPQ